MDLTKAQYLLIKIQTFLENGNGNELSRLERDLMKSYIIQLYDAVSSEAQVTHETGFKQAEMPIQKPWIEEVPAPPKMEVPAPIRVLREAVVEADFRNEPVTPNMPSPEPGYVPPVPVYVAPAPEPTPEPVKITKPVVPRGVASEELIKLFELNHPQEMSSRFSHVQIDNIESALGLNERIFTLNVLFGGNRELFESTCKELNGLQSFSEATNVLLGGPARQYNWADPESVKMAEHFIRIVSRRYPKS